MQSLARNGYSEQEVKNMLHGGFGSRAVTFRYDLLDQNERKKGELQRVSSGEVSMSAFSTIKRTAKFTLEDELVDERSYYTWGDLGENTWSDYAGSRWRELWTIEKEVAQKVDWLNDRIQPFVVFQMPDGGSIEFSLGIFLPSSPTKADSNDYVTRDIEAYDGLIILDQDKFIDRYFIPVGTKYETAVKDILRSAGITKINIEIDSNRGIQTEKEFALGDSKLEAINSLLSSLNNTPLWVDAHGYYRSSPYERPDKRASSYNYTDSNMSIIIQGIEEELDLFETSNSWVLTVSNPEEEPLVARRENNNSDSPTSIPSRGRRIVDFRKVNDISDQQALEGKVERIASEASQVYGKVKFSTPIMPMHEYYDVFNFEYSGLDINNKYSETKWSIPLEAGGEMTHEVRRTVSID